MSKWRPSENRIGTRRAIELKTPMAPNTHETCLVGRYGEIWEYSKTQYAAVITSVSIANKLAPLFNKKAEYSNGDEMLIRFGKEHLETVASAIKIVKNQDIQATLAENFGL
jgi:hypothetical protein